MLIPETPIKFRKRTGQGRRPPRTRPIAALTLVSAVYDLSASLTLSFNKPIDITQLVYASMSVTNGTLGFVWVTDSPGTLLDPQTVQLVLLEDTAFAGSGVHLTAPGNTGIVAVEDGEPWGGVMDLALPWP